MGKITDLVDGFSVDNYEAAFQGAAEVEHSDAQYMSYDEDLLVVVRVRVKMPRLKEARNGDITRVNVLGVKELALVRSDKLREHLCETLGLERPDAQLQLLTPVPNHQTDVRQSEADVLEVPPGAAEVVSEVFVAPAATAPKVKAYSIEDDDGPSPSGSKANGEKALAAFLAE